jgi:hypothetical protein
LILLKNNNPYYYKAKQWGNPEGLVGWVLVERPVN